jgi:hypothetical protein
MDNNLTLLGDNSEVVMPKKITFICKIEDIETGSTDISATTSRPIPDLSDFEKSGFTKAFNELETAVIESSKEINKEVTEKYLDENSKKKPSKNSSSPGRKPSKDK